MDRNWNVIVRLAMLTQDRRDRAAAIIITARMRALLGMTTPRFDNTTAALDDMPIASQRTLAEDRSYVAAMLAVQ